MTPEDQADVRRIVREEVRAALRDMIPMPFKLLNYKQAAKWINNRRSSFDTRKPLTARDTREWVDHGHLRAFTFGTADPLVAASDLEWSYTWATHTRDERDREWEAYKNAEKAAAEELRKARRAARSK